MKQRKLVKASGLFVVALVIAAMLLQACGGGGDTITPGTTPPTTTTTTPPTTTTTTPPTTLTDQQPIEIVSIGSPVPPYQPTPGGPTIEIILKNVSAEPIVTLTATLELTLTFSDLPEIERTLQYYFDISVLHPLLPTQSISAGRILIGPYGVSKGTWYPLVVEGTMQSEETFVYTTQVQIWES